MTREPSPRVIPDWDVGERKDVRPRQMRHEEIRSIADDLWEVGKDWSQASVEPLDGVLQVDLG